MPAHPIAPCATTRQHGPGAARGFTLIELMITVAVIGILAAIAYPSYLEYLLRTRRVDAQNLLSEAAARQERWRAQNGSYTTTVSQLKLPNGNQSEQGHYTLTIGTLSGDGGYTLTATANAGQGADRQCGNFTLNALGTKGVSAGTVERCWR